jgi:predicted RNA-binding Zn ribbon-like protein
VEHPAIELVNTMAWRGDPRRTVDRLTGPPEQLDAIRELREVVHRLLTSVVERTRPSHSDLAAINAAALDARRGATVADDLPLRWSVRGGDVVGRLALDAADLLTDPATLARLGRCGDPDCGWFFLDTSRSHTRRWCGAGDCGNRERARRHYARRRRA